MDGLAEGVEEDTAEMMEGLAPLEEEVCAPLAGLRERFVGGALEEYAATGATPEKTRYLFQSHIPRTAKREVLLSQLAGEGGDDDAGEEEQEAAEEDDAEATPTAQTAVPTRLTPSHHPAVLPDVTLTPVRSPARDGTPSRLREVHPNLGGVLSPPPIPSQTATQEGMSEKMEGVEAAVPAKGKEKERESLLPMPMPMPLLKPGLGNAGTGGAVAKTRAGRLPKRLGGLLVGDGAENVPPAAAMRSSTRRKSPRLR